MTTIVNITTSTGAININNNSDQTINPNIYIIVFLKLYYPEFCSSNEEES